MTTSYSMLSQQDSVQMWSLIQEQQQESDPGAQHGLSQTSHSSETHKTFIISENQLLTFGCVFMLLQTLHHVGQIQLVLWFSGSVQRCHDLSVGGKHTTLLHYEAVEDVCLIHWFNVRKQ